MPTERTIVTPVDKCSPLRAGTDEANALSLAEFIPPFYEAETVSCPHLTDRERRLREAQSLAWSHAAKRWLPQDLNPGCAVASRLEEGSGNGVGNDQFLWNP